MTSLKEWIDSLSQEVRDYVVNNCDWIDTSSEDYYRHAKLDDNYFNNLVRKAGSSYYSTDYWKSIILGLTVKLNEIDRNILKSFLSEPTIKSIIKEAANGRDKLYAFSPVLQKEIKRVEFKNDENLCLSDLLYITEDYSNIDYKRLDRCNLKYRPAIKEMLGIDACIELARSNIDFIKVSVDNLSLNDEVIDTLFFGDNQLSRDQKIQVIRYMYNPSIDDIEDYMKRFVSVDESYLRYLYNIINQDPAVAAKLYNLKKPEHELTGNETTEMKYRYPRKYRKLFQMAACCSRKNVGKAMAGTIGELSSMLKMYNWDFNALFDCMYPDSIENESEENESEVLES